MYILSRIVSLIAKLALCYFVFVIVYTFAYCGFGPFLLLFGGSCAVFILQYALNHWPNHQIFRRPSLWQLGIIAAASMSIAGVAYGLCRFGAWRY